MNDSSEHGTDGNQPASDEDPQAPDANPQDPYLVLQALYSSQENADAGPHGSTSSLEDANAILKALYLRQNESDARPPEHFPSKPVPEASPPEHPPGQPEPHPRPPAPEAGPPMPASAPPDAVPLPLPQPVERIVKPGLSPTQLYIAIGAGLGILFGIAVAAFSWRSGSSSGPYDLGPVNSSTVGLTGHLYTKWDEKLEYRLIFEPSDLQRQAAFSLAVADPPRPLSITVQLKDALGFLMCSKEIVLKYDAAKAAAPAAANSGSPAGTADASAGQGTQGTDAAQLNAQELQREQGKDIFQNEIGPDGQVATINAQGEFPCSRKSYESTVSWSFSPNFPTLAEQDQWLQHQAEVLASPALPSVQKTGGHKKQKPPVAEEPLAFSVEGDDVIAAADASGGTLQTGGGRTFIIDRTGNAGRWQVYPANIHYKCDQNAVCLLTRPDSGVVLRARLKR